MDPKGADAWQSVPNARIATLPGAGHTPFVERPSQMAAVIAEFVRVRD